VIPSAVLQRYTNLQPYVEWVGKRVQETLWAYCEQKGYALQARRKEPGSLAEKIETGRYGRWSDLDDQFACTIVIPTLSAEASVLEFLSQQFNGVEVRTRNATRKDPAIFRYDATRFIGRLKDLPTDTAPEIHHLKFEVQIRSALEHAWSVATHSLAYKSDTVDWRRLRLAAQLKASIEQLDLLIAGFEHSADLIPTQHWPEVEARTRVERFFKKLVVSGAIPAELQPERWSRFCENYISLIRNTAGYNARQVTRTVDESLATIQQELDEGRTAVPTSISLIQFAFGVLAQAGRIRSPLERYSPLVTDQLITLYPAVNAYAGAFDFEV
jgi:ppGpp synthetase/RelA/SpoT-type nucleotidyltranferase